MYKNKISLSRKSRLLLCGFLLYSKGTCPSLARSTGHCCQISLYLGHNQLESTKLSITSRVMMCQSDFDYMATVNPSRYRKQYGAGS